MHYLIIIFILISGCGSISPELAKGTAFYPEIQNIQATSNKKTKSFNKDAYGCFANSLQATKNEIINPALQSIMDQEKAKYLVNIKAERMMAPTIADAITGAFIWSCSYWTLTGDSVSN